MKTYLKRPADKSASGVFYSSSDTFTHLAARVSSRPRIVQPSTREQHRLLSSTSAPRLQHVHSGRYGIRPLWPPDDDDDEAVCRSWQHGKKSSKYRSSSSSRNYHDRCSRHTSDWQKPSILSLAPYVSYVHQEHGLTLLLASASILLLLLIYFIYRQCSPKRSEPGRSHAAQRRRSSVEDTRLLPDFADYRLPSVSALPTIFEENASTLSPSTSSSTLTQLLSSASTTSSTITEGRPANLFPIVDRLSADEKRTCRSSLVGDNDVAHSSPTPIPSKQKPPTDATPAVENIVRISLKPKEEQPASNPARRRSRFEQASVTPTTDLSSTDDTLAPPVIVRKTSLTHDNVIRDDFTSLEEIDSAVKEVGLERSQLIFGIDYTISNLETGKNSFHGLSLHNIQEGLLNPYQSVITIVGRTLEKYDSDSLIPAFGFGDRSTLDRKIFPLRPDGSYCKGFRGVLDAYNEITPKVRMSGPTNFAPLIREAIRIVKKTKQYHILVIVADGQVTNEKQTKDAIVEASNHPLSIVMIGVGDGPWDMMEEFDDSLPTRQFDNFQFVNYNSVVEASTNTDSSFALRALMEIPSQYAAIKKLGLL